LRQAWLCLIPLLVLCGCGSSSRHNGADGSAGGETGSGGTADVSGTASPALIGVDHSTVSLGTLELHQDGVATVTVTNIGAVRANLLSLNTTDDLEVSGCDGALPVQDSCELTITAHPTKVGPWSGTLTIAAFPLGAPDLEVQVTATVVGGRISVFPGTIALGNVLLDNGVHREEIILSASGEVSDLTLTTFGPDVSIDRGSSTCGATLAAGSSCVIVAYVATTSPGTLNDAVLIGYGGPQGPRLVVPITGKVQTPATLVLSTSQLLELVAAPGQTSPAIALTVANIGDFPTGDLTTAITGDHPADFQATSDCLTLPAYATCTLTLSFAPPAAIPAVWRDATLVLADTSPGGSSVTVDLSGFVSTSKELVISPDIADLGQVTVGTKSAATTVSVLNPGSAPTGALSVKLDSNEFLLVGDTCTGTSLAGQESCVLSIAFAPTAVGLRGAVLVAVSAGAQPAARMVTGKGKAVDVSFATPPALQFTYVDVGRTSAPENVSFSNRGQTNTDRLVLTVGGKDAGRFLVSNNDCAGILVPGEACSFDVTFSPTTIETSTAEITITDGKISATVNLDGRGFLQI